MATLLLVRNVLTAVLIALAGASAGAQSALSDLHNQDGNAQRMGASASGSALKNLRGVHLFTPTSAAQAQAMKNAVPGPLQSGQPLVAGTTRAQVRYSPYTNPAGVTYKNELAQFTLTDVALKNGSRLARAGFWLLLDRDTRQVILQFRPSLDSNLASVTGFPADINILLDSHGTVQLGNAGDATGDALSLIADVLAAGPTLVTAATLEISSESTFSASLMASSLERLRSAVLDGPDQFFNDLKNKMNAGWIGISVSMFVDTVSDPTVRLRYRPATGERDNEYATVNDDVLRAFILRAQQFDLGVYLTLALEDPGGDKASAIGSADPRCRTPQAPIHRSVLGNPELNPNAFGTGCLAAADFWWAPSHPLYAANKAKFFQSYTDIAVKYAKLAQETGVGLFSIGTETEYLFRQRATAHYPSHFGPELQKMAREVKQVFSGKITYDQHIQIHIHPEWFGGGEWGPYLAKDIGLDVIGLSAYVDAYATPPQSLVSLREIEDNLWQPAFNALRPLRAENPGVPIMFTEIGAVSDVGILHNQASNLGSAVTGRDASGVSDGMRQQGRVYEAFFNVNERNGGPITGAFFWANYIFPSGWLKDWCKSIDHHLQCSPPAMAALTTGYENWKSKDADRVFDWAEDLFPQFLPGHQASVTLAPYRFRYYPASGIYLGFANGRFVVHNGREFNLTDVGSLASLLAVATAAGY